MPRLASHNLCTGCMLCGDACGKKAISFDYVDGFYVPVVNPVECVECKACERVCPELNTTQQEPAQILGPIAGWSRDPELLKRSASGAAFAEIAIHFAESSEKNDRKWLIFGASLQDGELSHISVSNLSDLHLLQGTKYMASNLQGCYRKIRSELSKGTDVLFSGLPCQVNALKSYLGSSKRTGILLTCDLICNGVPSHELFELTKTPKNIVAFRDKKHGWGHETALTWIENGVEKRETLSNNYLLQSICKNHLMRPSCYDCRYATIDRHSDFTLGDFWGYRGDDSEAKMGVSLVIPHNEQAKEFFEEVQSFKTIPVTWDECLPGNPRIYCGKRFIGQAIPTFLKRRLTQLKPMTVKTLLTGECRILADKQFQWIPFKLWLRHLHKKDLRLRSKSLAETLSKLNNGKN